MNHVPFLLSNYQLPFNFSIFSTIILTSTLVFPVFVLKKKPKKITLPFQGIDVAVGGR